MGMGMAMSEMNALSSILSEWKPLGCWDSRISSSSIAAAAASIVMLVGFWYSCVANNRHVSLWKSWRIEMGMKMINLSRW